MNPVGDRAVERGRCRNWRRQGAGPGGHSCAV